MSFAETLMKSANSYRNYGQFSRGVYPVPGEFPGAGLAGTNSDDATVSLPGTPSVAEKEDEEEKLCGLIPKKSGTFSGILLFIPGVMSLIRRPRRKRHGQKKDTSV